MVLGDLIANLVAPLLTVALQLLSVLNTAGTIGGHVLGACARRASTNTGTHASGNAGPSCGRTGTGSGRKL